MTLNVLEAEHALLAAQDNVVQSERRLSQNLVRLYKALGGGVESRDSNGETHPTVNIG